MRRLIAVKNGQKLALLKENLEGEWKVFQYSNRQTYGSQPSEKGWTEDQAKKFVKCKGFDPTDSEVTFEEKN